MGLYLYLHRLPTDPAVDLLTERLSWARAEDQYSSLLERRHYALRSLLPEQPPHTLDFQRSYHTVRDAMMGNALSHEERFDELNCEEPQDPRFWAVHGRRLIGYEKRELIWRYSMPSDVDAICEVLGEMTEADVRANVERAIEEDRQYEGTTDRAYGRENTQRFMREKLAEGLLPTLRQFYEAARAEEQIVVRWMG